MPEGINEAEHRIERYKQRGSGAKECRPRDVHGAMIEIAPKSLAQAEGFNLPHTEPDELGLFF